MSTVLFLIGDTMGDALGSNGRALQASFERQGHEFLEVNFAQPAPFERLDQIINGSAIEFAFSFVGMATSIDVTTSEGKKVNVWDAMNIPFLTLHGDSPAYFFDRHIVPPGPFASLYGFREHYDLRKRLPELHGLIGVLPPAVEDAVPKSTLDFAKKERGKLLFLKNGNDPEQLMVGWRNCLAEPVFLMLADLATELGAHLDTDLSNDIDSLVCAYFRDKGWDLDSLVKLRIFFVAQLDDYCRRMKSTLIVESLLDFPIEVHGFNWDHVNFSKRRATLIPVADYSASRSLIRESLGVIDMSPNTGKSPHDRTRRAIGSYTICLTNEQQVFKDRYPNYKDFTFRLAKESISEKIAQVLREPKRFVELGIEVAETYRSSQDPDITTRYMLETASIIRMQRAGSFSGLQPYFAWPPAKIA